MITVTSSAVDHIKQIISSRDKDTIGIKVGISTKGCSGLSYTMQFVDKIDENDEMLVIDDIKVFIDKKSISFFNWYQNGLC